MLKKLFGNAKKEKPKGVENKTNASYLPDHEKPGAQEVIDMIIDPRVADIFGMRNMANWEYEMVPVGSKEELWPCMKVLREAEEITAAVHELVRKDRNLLHSYCFQRDNNEWMRDKIRKYKETGCDTYFNHALLKKYILEAKNMINYDKVDHWLSVDFDCFSVRDDIAKQRAATVMANLSGELRSMFIEIFLDEATFQSYLRTESLKFKE